MTRTPFAEIHPLDAADCGISDAGLVDRVLAGKRVVRLCSSDVVDPVREAAQAGWLRQRGVTVEAIPGVATTGQEVGWFGARRPRQNAFADATR
ncbi:hypothetical protein [Ciceribacter lividus]|uniref:hypothetical protein n=1 Tax=Ciceribacter lividus TaxID=1197950 RepID=UPI000DF41936|nr:hypothetical protein [Ciceribacter lividus]